MSDIISSALGVDCSLGKKRWNIKQADEDSFSIKESDLKNRLEGELAKIDGTDPKKEKTKKSDDEKLTITKERINNDLQLKSGIDILKALIITQR